MMRAVQQKISYPMYSPPGRSAVAARRKRNTTQRVPQLGDMVSLTRQRKGRIIGMHHDQLALIQISALPGETGEGLSGGMVGRGRN